MTEEMRLEEERIEEEKKELAAKKKKWIIISSAVALAGVLAALVLALCSTQRTILRNSIIGGIIVILAGWTAIFLYFSIAFPDRFTGRKIRDLLIHKETRMTGPVSKRIRITLLDWPKYVLAVMGAVLITGVIFINMDNVPARKKITFFVNTFQKNAPELEDTLYEARPDGITRVRVRMFTYALLSMREIEQSDIFIIHESDFKDFRENCADLTAFRAAHPELTYLEEDGVPYAIRIFDAETGEGAACSYLKYRIPEPEPGTPVEVNPDAVYTEDEDYYLFFTKGSVHTASLSPGDPKKKDDAAIEMLLYFLTLN